MPDYQFEREVNKIELKKEIESKIGITGVAIKTISNKCIITTPSTLSALDETKLKRILSHHNPDLDGITGKYLQKYSKENLFKALYNEIEADASLSANLKNYLKKLIEGL